ncbi:MAG: hypothetical protein AAFV45_09745 [Pseudomonadota bacterium]
MTASPGQDGQLRSFGLKPGLVKLSGAVLGAGVLAASLTSFFGVEQGLRTEYAAAFSSPGQGIQGATSVTQTADTKTQRAPAGSFPVAQSEDFWLGHAASGPGVPVSFNSPVSVGDRLTLSLNGRSQAFHVTGVVPGVPRTSGADVTSTLQTPTTSTQTVEITGHLPQASGFQGETRLKLLIEVTSPVDPSGMKSTVHPRQL